jgi:hypothetical protein
VFDVDASEPEAVRARISALQSWPTLPDDFTTTNYVGEIKIDAAGRFVYVSNRGHNSIAVFAVDQATGHLTPVAIQKTGGKCPRHFGLSPCGAFAVVGDQDSNTVRVFRVCRERGTLEAVPGGEYVMGSPCFVMVSARGGVGGAVRAVGALRTPAAGVHAFAAACRHCHARLTPCTQLPVPFPAAHSSTSPSCPWRTTTRCTPR